MYVTRRLSQLLQSPDILTAQPEGPNSGYLVIQDVESETYSCFGLCKNRTLKTVPFPQNKELTVRYTTSSGQSSHVQLDPVFLIPVLNERLSSNRYYAIVPHGKHIGEAVTCSREDDKVTCCFCRCVKDVKSRPLDPRDVYQQIEIVPYEGACTSRGQFYAGSLASDGFPPYFLRREGWTIYTKSAENCKLDTAKGVDYKTRARLPDFNFPLSQRSSESSIVGKWYCPFVFVKEGTLRNQVKKSLYYEVTLEQRWEQIFSCRRDSQHDRGNSVAIEAVFDKEEAFIEGAKARWNETEGLTWFSAVGEQKSVGVRAEVMQRMKWEQERFGYKSTGEETQVKIDEVETREGVGGWSEFACYVLVERFNLRRMDGSVALCYEFKHSDKMKSMWQ